MTATLHKLTAGDGYVYLVRQVAAADATERGRSSLADYYSAKGEAPGRWMGAGLSSLTVLEHEPVDSAVQEMPWRVDSGSEVTEDQMLALFGEGRHPNAVAITDHYAQIGFGPAAAIAKSQLGKPFVIDSRATAFQRALAVAYRDHNLELGRHWAAAIDPAVRAQLRTRVAGEQFAEEFGRPPADERELTGFIARGSRAATTAVAGYDVTFSPVKSVSALWAIAPRDIADKVEAAHDAAVAEAFDFLQSTAAYTRTGHGGVAQLDTTGLIAAAFTHRDSRAGDPDLHTHVAISNKVAVRDAWGLQRWYALDGQPLHRQMVAASELYNTRLEAHLEQSLGVRFAQVAPARRGRRPIREIVGVDQALTARWSTRRVAIEARTAELAKAFQAQHHREPTAIEQIALAQQATLETREAKHEPRSLAEQRAVWRSQAIEALGSQRQIAAMLADVLAPAAGREVAAITEEWVADQARQVIATIEQSRATWARHHVLAEAQRRIRNTGHAAHPELAAAITAAALGEGVSVAIGLCGDDDMGEPGALRRADGTSIYRRAGSQLYSSEAVLAAERRIVAAAARRDGRATARGDVVAALADASAHGRTLNPGQQALVLEMATSAARLQLALAPAGSGKTTAMAALSHAWRHSGGNVIGLAPTAAAAITLGEDLASPTDTVDKYVQLIDNTAGSVVPDWFRRVGKDTLLIVDEAGLAGTIGLDAVISNAIARGASVRLVGDDAQIASIAAGGVLRDIAETSDTLTLTQLVRFTTADAGAASLAMREGNPAGIAYFIDHQRVHVGTDATAAQMAFDAWWADTAAGKDSVLMAPANDTVDQLNSWARQARLDAALQADPGFTVGREVVLADGLAASVGDRIRTRKNNRRLRISGTDYVRNGYAWTITHIGDDGTLTVRHDKSGRVRTLPADYVAEHVTLGYALTINAAQGLTAGDRSHTVIDESMTRQDLYVATSRAKAENHLYGSTAEGDPHRILAPKATHPDTAADVLATICARDGRQVSASTTARHALDPIARLQAAANMYQHALGSLAEQRLSAATLTALCDYAATVHPQLLDCPTWPVLRARLALAAAAGRDPLEVFAETVGEPDSLADAVDPAAVLVARMDPADGRGGPLPWLPAIPAAMADRDTAVGVYLRDRAKLVRSLADTISTDAQKWTVRTAPDWAKALIAADAHTLVAAIAVMRAAHGVDPADTRLLGARGAIYTPAARRAAAKLAAAADRIVINSRPVIATWAATLDSLDERIRTDTYWITLADQLAALSTGRPDLHTHLQQALAERPLPDEHPAAALWWRLTGQLGLIAAADDPHHDADYPWIADLHHLLGTANTELVRADKAFPALAAHLAAIGDRWTATELLTLAVERLYDASPSGTLTEINPRHYARLITATVADLAAGPQRPGPLPETEPLTREEEEELAHEPLTREEEEELAHLDPLAEPEVVDRLAAVLTSEEIPDFDDRDPAVPDWADADTGAEDLGLLDFTDLARTRPTAPPQLTAALTDLTAARDDYRAAAAAHASLAAAIAAGAGPAEAVAADDLARDRAAAAGAADDRHHLAQLCADWADAEDALATTQALIDATRTQLDHAAAADTPDPDRIASLRADLAVLAMQLPGQTPAEQYWPAINAARTALAGIPTPGDIDAAAAAARHTDQQALSSAAARLAHTRRELDRAEHLTAIAYRHAHPDTLDELLNNHHAIDCELAVLDAAGHSDSRNRLTWTGPAHNPTEQMLAQLADQPYTLTIATCNNSSDLAAALTTLTATADTAGRCITHPDTAEAADYLTTWAPEQGDIVILTDPADLSPDTIAGYTRTAADNQARIIIIDTTSDQAGPATPMLNLLRTDLPWHTHLNTIAGQPDTDRTRGINTPGAPDLQPALTQTSRLPDQHLKPHHQHALDRRNELRTKNQQQHRLHQITHEIATRQHATPTHDHDLGIDL